MMMWVNLGWVEPEFQGLFFAYAFFYGGVCQLLVGIFELLRGSTFSFAVFGSYGAYWLAWGLSYQESHRTNSELIDYEYSRGKTANSILWGILSTCFFVVALRKNVCLSAIFSAVIALFFLEAIAYGTGSDSVQKAAGVFGFAAAIMALYTGMAEIINEEYGRSVLPGLAPLRSPERFLITKENVFKLISYHSKSNTLRLHFRGLHIMNYEDVQAIKEAVIGTIMENKAPDNKVHAIIDYKDVCIADSIAEEYWSMVADIEQNHYLSARRFHVTSFGTRSDVGGTNNMPPKFVIAASKNHSDQQ
ncbi:hypothetical protein MPSEU_000292000 [Mayamaea pseudoterrestris]|nr:hypothetical protein MPSEU_000292000 [Mayamaea pseudoterrestris]